MHGLKRTQIRSKNSSKPEVRPTGGQYEAVLLRPVQVHCEREGLFAQMTSPWCPTAI